MCSSSEYGSISIFSKTACIRLMWSSVVPQHPPITFTPALLAVRAYFSIISGDPSYIIFPSLHLGMPQFPLVIIWLFLLVVALSFSIVSIISDSPMPQFPPYPNVSNSSQKWAKIQKAYSHYCGSVGIKTHSAAKWKSDYITSFNSCAHLFDGRQSFNPYYVNPALAKASICS